MTNTYQIDPAHSSSQFTVRHLMVSNVRGFFSGLRGSVQYDPDRPDAAVVEATIDVATVNTHDAQRDAHLKTAEFFDVEKYPHITFRSTKVTKTGEGEFDVAGDLTIHGVTKPVVLKVDELSGETKDPWGNTRIGVSAQTKIKRGDFGLTWNAALETGGVVVGDEVKLSFDLELVKAQSAAA
jgi:polyisoprenoid-binding protein YceI